nr:MAG TPA_asm: transferase [Caudoviricetes sp.]
MDGYFITHSCKRLLKAPIAFYRLHGGLLPWFDNCSMGRDKRRKTENIREKRRKIEIAFYGG